MTNNEYQNGFVNKEYIIIIIIKYSWVKNNE